jgi:hypothetical protein
MTIQSAFRKRYEELVKAPSYGVEATKISSQLWDWTMETNIRVWDELANERLAEYGKREWNEFAKYVLKEIQVMAQTMREAKAKKEE